MYNSVIACIGVKQVDLLVLVAFFCIVLNINNVISTQYQNFEPIGNFRLRA